MSDMGLLRGLERANYLAALYQRAEAEWSRNRLRSAFRLFLFVAEHGVVPAFGTVAQFYDFGTGVKVDQEAALYWYRRAARHGDCSAANNIGCIWRDRGKLSRALAWLERAVKLGDPDANLNIALVYLRQKRDPAKAAIYLTKISRSVRATEGSREEARLLLKQLRKGKVGSRQAGRQRRV